MSKYDSIKTLNIGMSVVRAAKERIDASENPNVEASEKMQTVLDRYASIEDENSED